MRLVSLCFLFFTIFQVSAQEATELSTLNKKCQKKYSKALKHIKSKNYEKATKDIQAVLKPYPHFHEGRKKLVSIYLKLNKDSLALPHLKIIADQEPTPDPKVFMTLVDILENEGDYSSAISYTEKLLSTKFSKSKGALKVKQRLKVLQFRHHAYSNPVPFNPTPLSANVNTIYSESLPALNADGSIMVYTSLQPISENSQRKQEDLYMTQIKNDGTFTKGKSIVELNTFENEGAHTFSQDGKTIIFTACNRRDSYGGCDLYISFNKNGRWSEPQNMGPNINSRYSEKQPSLSADKKTLFFTSTRKGGKGKEDIWKVSLIGNKWSEPVNLGPTINTAENEGSPFIHPDNKTLYFRSDGHIGLGGYDLFITRKENADWSTPNNLGYPINSTGNDGAIFVDLQGQYAYYTSDKFNNGAHLDILKFKIPESIKPLPVSYLKINVADIESHFPLQANIEIFDLNDNKSSSNIQSDQNGSALLILQPGNFAVNVVKDGYFFYSENINIDKQSNIIEPFVFEALLQPIRKEVEKYKPIVLNNIFFETGSSELLDISNNAIQNLVSLLNEQPEISIQIIGHTDNVGDEEDNLILSTKRAEAVYNKLIENGISKSRLSFIGKGESEPIASNDTPEGKKANRRTTFIVTQ
ncbi:MAG: OmpA family protein [Saprospiraceae bacterium]|nr:OmpA family protein [Saprospiraceae bacterium]